MITPLVIACLWNQYLSHNDGIQHSVIAMFTIDILVTFPIRKVLSVAELENEFGAGEKKRRLLHLYLVSIEDFLNSHVNDRFCNHGNVWILVDSEIRFSIVDWWSVDEEFPAEKWREANEKIYVLR